MVIVFSCKKIGRGLQAANGALANGIAGHQNNKLGEFEFLAQAVNGFNKSKGFTRAGFHQHIQRQRGRCRAGHQHIACRNLAGRAHGLDIGADLLTGFCGLKERIGVGIFRRNKAHIVQHLFDIANGLGLVSQAGVLKLGGSHGLTPLTP